MLGRCDDEIYGLLALGFLVRPLPLHKRSFVTTACPPLCAPSTLPCQRILSYLSLPNPKFAVKLFLLLQSAYPFSLYRGK
jgi:hypothetical protein